MLYAAMVLSALSQDDPRQWRWIAPPLGLVAGVFTVVRPQAAFEVDPRYWFRGGRREPSAAALRWHRASGILLTLIGLFGLLVAPILWP